MAQAPVRVRRREDRAAPARAGRRDRGGRPATAGTADEVRGRCAVVVRGGHEQLTAAGEHPHPGQAARTSADDHHPAALARAVPGFLDQADEHVSRLGFDGNELCAAFGPTDCQIHQVAAHVQLSEGADAVAVAADIPAAFLADLPRERRAHLLTDRAIGEKQAGLRTEAVATLLTAEEEAPEEVVCRPRTRQLVEALRLPPQPGPGSSPGSMAAGTPPV